MPKNRQLQNIIGTEHITDSSEAAIAAQAASGNVLDDTSPQLGGNLDVNGNALVSTSNGNIELNPNGSGKVVFKGNATKGAGQFVLNCEQNTHGIIIKGPPHSASASYTLTLPDDDGSSNDVLKTDGSGNLSWVAQSSGGSPGGSDGQMQYNNGGSFGGSSLTFTDTDGSEQFLFSDTSDTALVKIEQLGTGNAFEVHDQATDVNIFKIDNAGKTVVGTSSSDTAHSAFQLYVAGDTRLSRLRVGTGSNTEPGVHFEGDSNTGIRRTAADQLGFITGGSERLAVGSAGEILIGGSAAGTSGQVLTSGGSGSAVTWATASGGGGGLSKAVGVGILSADPFANNSSYQSAYPLWACTTNTNGTGWSGYPSTTEVHLIPFQVPVDGDLAELAFRTSGSSWGPITTYWAIYGAGNDNLPVGAPLFNTSFSISPGNEYEFSVTGVTGKSAGDLLYFAFLGVTDIATITMQIGNMRDGGFGFIFPRRISSSNINHQILRNYTMLKYTGATAGTFPTIGANHAFDNTVSNTFLLNIGARYS